MREFDTIRVIGQGSFGAAILVRSLRDGQYYVAKQITVSEMSDKERSEAVSIAIHNLIVFSLCLKANEVRVLEILQHPNIISYHGSFVEDGSLYIVMDYADGTVVDRLFDILGVILFRARW